MEPNITIVGLGAGDAGHLTLAGWQALQSKRPLFLRTAVHPTVEYLTKSGLTYRSFDHLYDQVDSFDQLYPRIAEEILQETEKGPLTYAVPGHPRVGEKTVEILLAEAGRRGLTVDVIPGVSFLEAMYTTLGLDPSRGLTVLDGLDLKASDLAGRQGIIITQMYSPLVASEVKLTLMERYPDEYRVTVIRAAGVSGEERVETIPLYQLDRLSWVDHLTSVYVPPKGEGDGADQESPAEEVERESGAQSTADRFSSGKYPLDPLVDVMFRLLGEGGCPWDREQTHESLKPYLLEESYEVLEAIDLKDDSKIREELGDVLLQVVFHGVIAQQEGRFQIGEIVQSITEKMIRRHPHVFADISVADSKEVLVNWEAIKAQEKGEKVKSPSGIDKVTTALPALLRAEKLQKRAARIGFDWVDWHGPREKVREELAELVEAIDSGDKRHIRDELGDLFFAVVNLARFFQVNPEEALHRTSDKFIRRFRYVEECCRREQKNMTDCSLEEMDKYWDEAKAQGL
ncbi:nucleoside triphosphate pyrophosphohydrolase [Heliobacterium chlorum]|uniref:Nucleoside triphosphate pyrophosphohydrolase n=1 Tax=Heliobacterium chlorum TaxID=2698 RepID=A0ABR7T2V2_HELCL|nr:nucleoside triphosphate pyrophosphohydrolase [Heliobacterium chlorum]MBC9784194.1 nucleoside triphosphate pyrophosphohydrolase [Heliobacterium chlorum]